MLSQLFNEDVSSSKSFDKKAKHIIRSQYKLITEKNSEKNNEKPDRFKSEMKEPHRSALSALSEPNSSTNESEKHQEGFQTAKKPSGNRIVNYYNGEVAGKSPFLNKYTIGEIEYTPNGVLNTEPNFKNEYAEIEKLYHQIGQLESDNENYQILINEKDRTIKLLNGSLDKKSQELQK